MRKLVASRTILFLLNCISIVSNLVYKVSKTPGSIVVLKEFFEKLVRLKMTFRIPIANDQNFQIHSLRLCGQCGN